MEKSEMTPPVTTSNEDEEPQMCTVFSSNPSTHSAKTIFDTIAFSVPKKENSVLSPTSPFSPDILPPSAAASSQQVLQVLEQGGGAPPPLPISSSEEELTGSSLPPTNQPNAMFESLCITSSLPFTPLSYSASATAGISEEHVPYQSLSSEHTAALSSLPHQQPPVIGQTLNEESLRLVSKEIESLSLKQVEDDDDDEEIPTANVLFSNSPEVPFPVAVTGAPPPLVQPQPPAPVSLSTAMPSFELQQDAFSNITYATTKEAPAYDAWIPTPQTKQILQTISSSVNSGTYFPPDKANMTTPGVIYKEELVDKVAVNMSRIFGEAEASKRQILTADNVPQDDNGIRELIKLGCYRSAINLTKRLLTLYGQGPGKIGQFSKHTPHSLQLWMTRIALLVRIREFKIADSELVAFQEFENADMYYEYYQDLYGQGRKGSMVPFHFRLMAAEIPQYAAKDYNSTCNKLQKILQTIQEILKNLEDGLSEDGSPLEDSDRKQMSLRVWKRREIRVLYSFTNAFILAKDFANALRHFHILRETDTQKRPQITSAIGRLFLQFGDLPTAQKYFKEAASLRSSETEVERVENLVDAALYFIAQGLYGEAFALLKEALAIQPDNFMVTNNMAVCLLYLGKVKESLQLMETTVQNNKPQLLQENVILNLSTIYELENSHGLKKNQLLKLISEYKGDGINLASLKMPNLI